MKFAPSTLLCHCAATLFASLASGLAADLYSEPFDSAATAKVATNNGTGMNVSYVDYSNLTVGAITHNIAEAPRQIAGSAPTRGVMIQVNYPANPAATERIANLVAADGVGGSRLTFTDNYRLKFDCYMRLSPSVTLTSAGIPASNAGTTEQVLWGVGYTASLPMGRGFRSGRGSGIWGWLASEGGHSAASPISDAALWKAGQGVASRNFDLTSADTPTYFSPAFGADATPVPHCPANQWVEVDVTVLGGQVTVEYQAVSRTKTKFFENVTGGIVNGGAMIGYEDSFASNSFDPDNQWILLDNMVVEDLTPPTMLVVPDLPIVTYAGTPTTGTYTVQNLRAVGDLTISSINIAGANATDFSITTPLPLIVPASSSATLTVGFNPATPNGIKTSTITLASDDPQKPNYVISDVKARRSVGNFLMAHYKLDEASGTTAFDSSANSTNAGFQVREALVFGKDSLLGPTDATGKAIEFLPAQTGTTGNYFVATDMIKVPHVPTYSISLWMRPQATGAIRTLYERHESFAAPYEKLYGLLLTTDGILKYRVNNIEELSFGPAIIDGEVWHVVITHLDEDGFGNTTAKRTRLFVNGLRVAEKLDGGGCGDYSLSPTAPGLYFASRTAAGFGFKGDLDDVQIYGAELTPEQVWDLYKRPGVTALQSPDFQIINATFDGSKFSVEFPSNPSLNYSLQRSSNLQNWEYVLESAPAHISNPTTILEDIGPDPAKRYYRVQRN